MGWFSKDAPKTELAPITLEGGDELTFEAPPDAHVELRQNVYVHRGTVLHEVWHAPEQGTSVGGPHAQRYIAGSANIDLQESAQAPIRKGLIGRAAGWLTSAPSPPALASPQHDYRGEIMDVSYAPVNAPQYSHAALPAPGTSGGQYLPAPSSPSLAPPPRAPQGAPMLTHQGQPMPDFGGAHAPQRAKFTR